MLAGLETMNPGTTWLLNLKMLLLSAVSLVGELIVLPMSTDRAILGSTVIPICMGVLSVEQL